MAGVLVVSGLYGLVIGFLGPDVVESLNGGEARFDQAQIVFTGIGAFMLIWVILEIGFADRFVRAVPESVRSALGSTRTKAATLVILYFAKNKITAVGNQAPWKFRLISAVALLEFRNQSQRAVER